MDSHKGYKICYNRDMKNTHLEHLEDNILNGGVNGARESMNFLRSIRDMLAGNSTTSVNVSVKWDGAPAIFAVSYTHLTLPTIYSV